MRRLIPPLAALILPACLVTTTPQAFCEEQIKAECEKEASCRGEAEWKSCVAARQPSCEGLTEAILCDGGKYDPAKGQECVDAYASAECGGLSRGDRPAACHEYCSAG